MKIKQLKFPAGTIMPSNNKQLSSDIFDIEKLGNSDWFKIDNHPEKQRQMPDPFYIHVSGVYFIAEREQPKPKEVEISLNPEAPRRGRPPKVEPGLADGGYPKAND